ncbi:hypothetical protein BGZ93_011123 [Podila epicladia]|nr:hypothetical protein BGZ93_011123 [Podila epicladia]
MSPRDVHAVTSILDAFGAWHSLLPKSLRAHSSKSASSSKSPFSPHAAILDLYYRLGQILLLNNLPQSTRSSPTGLGPRREPPLRTLATCANGITATISDFLKSADLKNYCLSHGMRCLTEAATIQMANTRESDPNISTPAKVNLMKTLWCIRQINFGLPAGKLSAILESFDASKATAPEPDVESRDYRVPLMTSLPPHYSRSLLTRLLQPVWLWLACQAFKWSLWIATLPIEYESIFYRGD